MKWLIPAIAAVVGACSGRPELVWRADYGRVYCYETLADPDCYAEPEPGARRRLIAIGPRISFQPKWRD